MRANPAGKAIQEAMFSSEIPVAAFESADLDAEYQRLSALGIIFLPEPQQAGPVKIAVFSDRCGNLIQIYQPLS